MYPKKITKIKNSLQNTTTLTDKQIENKKSALVDKITQLIKLKYKKYLKENNIDLHKEISYYLTNDLLKNFDYEKFIAKVEKEIIQKYINNTIVKNEELHINELNDNEKANLNNNDNNIEKEELIENVTPKQQDNTDNNLSNKNIHSPFDKKIKLEVLKNIKEKDDWALLAKQEYERYIEDNKNKHILTDLKQREIKEILSKQIVEKNDYKENVKQQSKETYNNANFDYENWKQQEKNKKVENIKKNHHTVEFNHVLAKVKCLKENEEDLYKKMKEQELLNRISYETKIEKEKVSKKKQAEKNILHYQIEDIKNRDSHKKTNHLKEIGIEKQNLQEYDKIMERLDLNRINIKNNIKERAKVQEIRQNLITNVKVAENFITRELENKYLKEKQEIEKRSKKNELIEEVKKTLESQKFEKNKREVVIKEMNREFDNKLQSSYNDFIRQKEEKEKDRKSVINKYRLELDKQVIEKNERLKKPLMDDVERQINKINI